MQNIEIEEKKLGHKQNIVGCYSPSSPPPTPMNCMFFYYKYRIIIIIITRYQ